MGFEALVRWEHPRLGLLPTWQPSAPEPRGTILVVDPDADTRARVSHRLRRAGFATVRGIGGVEALATVQSRPIDLLIVGLPMIDVHPIEFGTALSGPRRTSRS